ncbi:colicin immunity protein Cui [Erwinia papayae]|uniref:Colicin immunity protein Cui n=1 Tax=Erwinia papayae TaxID=206499 RepID=A0ABV3N3Z5_9GAMM
MEHADIVRKNNEISKRMLVFMALSAIPILFIFAFYQDDPQSPLLKEIASFGADWPAVMSAKNQLMSKVMDIYCKTAPIFALLFVLPPCHWVTLKTETSLKVLIKTTLLYLLFYSGLVYIFLFYNHELTTKKKLLKIMSSNDYLLTIFYTSLYAIIFIFTIFLFWLIIGICKESKERY